MRRTPLFIVSAVVIGAGLAVLHTTDTQAWFGKKTARPSVTSSSSSAVPDRRAERLAEAAKRPKSSAPTIAKGTPLTTYRVPILVYHHVRKQEGWSTSTWSWKMTVTPETFERHMQHLVDKGYETITMSDMTAAIRGERTMPAKPVVITFDDNNASQYDVAVPIMEKYGHKAVFYLVTKYLDTPHLLNRDKALELQAKGHEIESHTLLHRALTGLNDDELRSDLVESKRILEELTGTPITHLCYPGTAHSQRVRDAARAAGYETATIMDPVVFNETHDWMKILRIMMTDDTDITKVLP